MAACIAYWIDKAIEQKDMIATPVLRLWYGRPLRNTPHWAKLLRRLNLPESS